MTNKIDMLDIKQNLRSVHERIHAAELKYQRQAGSVNLIAVTKTKPATLVQAAVDEGQYLFGENYVQEAIEKIEVVSNPMLVWHFLGPIQSNKTRIIAQNFDWVHSVDRLKIAQRLSDQRPTGSADLNVCLQVNISEEHSKSGVSLNELSELVGAVLELPNLNLRGFMVIPQKSSDLQQQRLPFAAMRKAKEEMEHEFGITLDTLSMGMSADMEAAIAEGASHVRIGTDIFGSRDWSKSSSV